MSRYVRYWLNQQARIGQNAHPCDAASASAIADLDKQKYDREVASYAQFRAEDSDCKAIYLAAAAGPAGLVAYRLCRDPKAQRYRERTRAINAWYAQERARLASEYQACVARAEEAQRQRLEAIARRQRQIESATQSRFPGPSRLPTLPITPSPVGPLRPGSEVEPIVQTPAPAPVRRAPWNAQTTVEAAALRPVLRLR